MPAPVPVTTVADARIGLSRVLAGFRADPLAPPVVIGAHRRAEAVLVPYGQFESTPTARATKSLLEILREKKALIARLGALSHVRAVSVFGSVARQAETETSDIDLLVDLDDEATLFDLAQFEIDLEAVFDRPVDLVSRRSLTDADAAILREAVPL